MASSIHSAGYRPEPKVDTEYVPTPAELSEMNAEFDDGYRGDDWTEEWDDDGDDYDPDYVECPW